MLASKEQLSLRVRLEIDVIFTDLPRFAVGASNTVMPAWVKCKKNYTPLDTFRDLGLHNAIPWGIYVMALPYEADLFRGKDLPTIAATEFLSSWGLLREEGQLVEILRLGDPKDLKQLPPSPNLIALRPTGAFAVSGWELSQADYAYRLEDPWCSCLAKKLGPLAQSLLRQEMGPKKRPSPLPLNVRSNLKHSHFYTLSVRLRVAGIDVSESPHLALLALNTSSPFSKIDPGCLEQVPGYDPFLGQGEDRDGEKTISLQVSLGNSIFAVSFLISTSSTWGHLSLGLNDMTRLGFCIDLAREEVSFFASSPPLSKEVDQDKEVVPILTVEEMGEIMLDSAR